MDVVHTDQLIERVARLVGASTSDMCLAELYLYLPVLELDDELSIDLYLH